MSETVILRLLVVVMVITGIIITVAAALLAHWLRKRSSTRCPACSYPTATAEGICTECGKHRDAAWRTWHRRYLIKSTVLVMAMVVIGYGPLGTWYYATDWPTRVPNWVLVRIAPVGPDEGLWTEFERELYSELLNRRWSSASLSAEADKPYLRRYLDAAIKDEWLIRFHRDPDDESVILVRSVTQVDPNPLENLSVHYHLPDGVRLVRQDFGRFTVLLTAQSRVGVHFPLPLTLPLTWKTDADHLALTVRAYEWWSNRSDGSARDASLHDSTVLYERTFTFPIHPAPPAPPESPK